MPRHNKTTEPIRLYEISGLANAGIYIKSFTHGPEMSDHDVSVAHRDNHYLLMVAVSGYYKGLVDFRNFESDGPCIGIILPGQVHQVDLITAPVGWSIAFDPALMPDNLKHKLEGYFSRQPLLPYQELLQERVTQLTALMCDIYQECGQSNTATALHALLHAILGLISRQLEDLPADGGDKQRRAFIIERDFWELLHQHYKEWKKPSDYAGALNISVSHLNDTIREITGCSASYQIRQMAVLEAKRLLYHTDLTAREIGYEVGYDDPVYFSRLFRKTTGQTPLAFRGKFRD